MRFGVRLDRDDDIDYPCPEILLNSRQYNAQGQPSPNGHLRFSIGHSIVARFDHVVVDCRINGVKTTEHDTQRIFMFVESIKNLPNGDHRCTPDGETVCTRADRGKRDAGIFVLARNSKALLVTGRQRRILPVITRFFIFACANVSTARRHTGPTV